MLDLFSIFSSNIFVKDIFNMSEIKSITDALKLLLLYFSISVPSSNILTVIDCLWIIMNHYESLSTSKQQPCHIKFTYDMSELFQILKYDAV